MNKSDLIQALATQTNMTKAQATRAVEILFDPENGLIVEALRRGERVQISGFGTFETRERKARTGRNPRTGREIRIGPTISATFRAGKALKEETVGKIKAALATEGYPAKPDPARMNLFVIFFWLMVFAVAATALYGPQAAALVEMFPTRVRYTAMSLPYHVGTGWIGGFLPVTSFALVAITGDIYASLWYPVIFTIIPILVSLFFLKETRGKPLEEV